MNAKTFYIVAIGNVNKSNGGQLTYGGVLCSATLSINESDRLQLADMLACANMDLIDTETFVRDYREGKRCNRERPVREISCVHPMPDSGNEHRWSNPFS